MKRAPIKKLVTRRELADRLGVVMQTITKWERAGLPIARRGRKGKPSRYNEAAVRAWLQAREDAATAPGAPMDLVRERATKERWQGQLAEQQFKVRAGELLPAGEVKQVWAAEQGAIRAKLLALPQTFADRIFRAGTLEGLPGVERALKDAIDDVLRELADQDRAPSPAPEGGGVETQAA